MLELGSTSTDRINLFPRPITDIVRTLKWLVGEKGETGAAQASSGNILKDRFGRYFPSQFRLVGASPT